MRLVHFTDYEGTNIVVNPEHVTHVVPMDRAQGLKPATCMIFFNAEHRCVVVRDGMDQVRYKLCHAD